eukprot:m.8048 g.8048  ORF g.8048 m.8048 type:complete len:434 (-) comp2498_c0_seq1:45-1346(-)
MPEDVPTIPTQPLPLSKAQRRKAAKRARRQKARTNASTVKTHGSHTELTGSGPTADKHTHPTEQPRKKRKRHKRTSSAQDSTSTCPPSSGTGAPTTADSHHSASDDDDDELLEGIFVNDTLYLRGTASDDVFASTRAADGTLIKVGKWVDCAAVLDKALSPHEDASDGDADVEVGAERTMHKVTDMPHERSGRPADMDFPFEVDPDDHCETPKEAYEHLAPILDELASVHGSSTRSNVHLWDPYYCSGSAAKHLASLGFTSCYHRKEDFYSVVAHNACPAHDVVVTNPPFSGEHIPRFLNIVATNRKPWCMLVPNWVYTKPYYPSIGASEHVFFVVPDKRYRFLPPAGARVAKASDTHKRTSPFPCFWFCGGFPPTVITKLLGRVIPGASVCRAVSQLPFHALADYDPRRKKLRSAMKRKKKRKHKGDDGAPL